jgi:membrane protease YdiL (CAAX protease family)
LHFRENRCRSRLESNVAVRGPHAVGKTSTALILLLLVPLNGSVAYFHMLPKALPFVITSATGLLLAGALLIRERACIHAALLTFLLAVWGIVADLAIWPSLIIPLIAYAVFVFLFPSLRWSVNWLRIGRFDRTVLLLMTGAVFLSSAALVVWFFLAKPDLAHFLKSIPSWNPALLIFEGIGFALLNAAMEESIYRGVLMQALDEALGPGWHSLILQAAAFGLLHIKGIPGDWIGVGMAMIYGLMLGIIRRRSSGILAPFATHIFADIIIFVILVLLVR